MNSLILIAVAGCIALLVILIVLKKLGGGKQDTESVEQPVVEEQIVEAVEVDEPPAEEEALEAEQEEEPEEPIISLEEEILPQKEEEQEAVAEPSSQEAEESAPFQLDEELVVEPELAEVSDEEIEEIQIAPAIEDTIDPAERLSALEEELVIEAEEEPAHDLELQDTDPFVEEELEVPADEPDTAALSEVQEEGPALVDEADITEGLSILEEELVIPDEEEPAIALTDDEPEAEPDITSTEERLLEAEELIAAAPEEREEAEPEILQDEGTTDPVAALTEALIEEPEATVEAPDTTAHAAVAAINLTLEQYAQRLNKQEEEQRAALQQAIVEQQVTQRDILQRELVLMNQKLALLDDSYADEVSCYEEVLTLLNQLEAEGEPVSQAITDLGAGDPTAAEDVLAGLIDTSHPFKAPSAYCSGRLAECRFDLQTALKRYMAALKEDKSNTDYLFAAGLTSRRLFKYKEAVQLLEIYAQACAERAQDDPVKIAEAKRELAYTYVVSGQHKKAGPLYKEAMTGFAKHLGQETPEMAISWFQIGELQETLGEYDKAVGLYKKALAILEKCKGPEDPMLTDILDKLAAICMELELEEEAVPIYERLVAIRKKILRPTHPQLAMSLNNLAESYRLQRQYSEAEECYRQSLDIAEQTQGKDHPSVGAILQELSKLCSSQKKNDEAKEYQERASAIFEKAVAAEEKRTKNSSLSLDL